MEIIKDIDEHGNVSAISIHENDPFACDMEMPEPGTLSNPHPFFLTLHRLALSKDFRNRRFKKKTGSTYKGKLLGSLKYTLEYPATHTVGKGKTSEGMGHLTDLKDSTYGVIHA